MSHLLTTVSDALAAGYNVKFSSIGFNFYVQVEKKEDELEMLNGNTSCLPMDDSHFDETTIGRSIAFLIDRDQKKHTK